MLPLVSLSAVSDNKAVKGIAVVVTITVGMLTIWYLMHQSKLTRLQIARHMLQHGDSIDQVKGMTDEERVTGEGRSMGFKQQAA